VRTSRAPASTGSRSGCAATRSPVCSASCKRPPKGEAVALPGYDLTPLDELTPHPVYAWMRWVQILSPTPARFASLRPLLDESLELAKAKWSRRQP
jgi:Family of unknown function (DUF6194)